MQLKIGDFGLAAKLEFTGEKRKTICGTPNYLAPEIIDGKGHSYQVDIWSLGVVMFTMLYGKPPFESGDAKRTYKKIKECEYAFNQDVKVSKQAKDLITHILVTHPSKRMTLDEILAHPFMNSQKIPQSLPDSALNSVHQAAQSNFIRSNHPSGNNGLNSMKTLDRMEEEFRIMKSNKTNDRLLCTDNSIQ